MDYSIRKQEIMNTFTAGSKEGYTKKELLSEMLELQKETAELTFGENATSDNCRIYNVRDYFEKQNKAAHNFAAAELQVFDDKAKELENLIRAEISGLRGEDKAVNVLEKLNISKHIFRNVELNYDGETSEIDAIVVTPYYITIVEVKNTSKDIYINKEGDFFRVSKFLRKEDNIAYKMDLKERLLRKALSQAGLEGVCINKVLVFTNDDITVECEYNGFKCCFLGQLNHIVKNGFRGTYLSADKIDSICNMLSTIVSNNRYPLDMDINEFKTAFADLKIKLDSYSERKSLFSFKNKNITAFVSSLFQKITKQSA